MMLVVYNSVHGFTFFCQQLVPLFLGESQLPGFFRESHVRIIHTEQDAIFGTGSKHTVRLVHTFCYQVID